MILATPGQRHEVTSCRRCWAPERSKAASRMDGLGGSAAQAARASWLPTRAIRSPAPGGWCAVVACRGDPDQVDQRRQPGFDRAADRGRNQVERSVGRLKQFRRVSTRYDKRACNYLTWVTLAAAVIWLSPFAERP